MGTWNFKAQNPPKAREPFNPPKLAVKPAGKPLPPSHPSQVTTARRGDKPVENQKVPSHDGEVEEAVLGAMLIEARAVRVARTILLPEHFYFKPHRTIYSQILQLDSQGVVADVVTIIARLRDTLKWAEVGGSAKITACTQRVVHAGHVEHYAKRVKGLYLDREITTTCVRFANQQTAELMERLRQLHLEREELGNQLMFEYETGMKGILQAILEEKKQPSYQTHYNAFDANWHGMKGGEINVWGASTNRGKSVFMMNLAHRAAKAGERCLIVGTEMAAMETIKRHLSIASGVEAWRIRKPELDQVQIGRLNQVIAQEMSKLPITILDDPEPNLAKIEAAISSSKAKRVFLDYLERFDMPPAPELRLQIKAFMKRLTTIARRNDVVIDLFSQLGRDTYGSEERPPVLSDLSESSSIEKEASRVTLLWSPKDVDKYRIREAPIELEDGMRYLQAINRKNRHGRTGTTHEFVLNELTLTIQELDDHESPFSKTV